MVIWGLEQEVTRRYGSEGLQKGIRQLLGNEKYVHILIVVWFYGCIHVETYQTVNFKCVPFVVYQLYTINY